MRKMFSGANIVDDKSAKTPFQVLESLSKEGYSKVYMVVGGDRVSEFKTRMKKYTEDFEVFDVLSAGERDPDAEGVVGMSGSKMRKAAVDDEFEKFMNGVPAKVPKRVALRLFKSIRKGMGLKEEYASFGEQTFDVRLANTDETRARGLMDVHSMPDGDGMLFVFDEEDHHGIWMKNTYIPLDVVWINEEGTIVDIATLQPHDLNTRMPSKPAKYVLEVNAGTFTGSVGDNIGSVQLDESVELNELSKEARRKMARAARRTSKRRAMKRKVKARRMKGSDDLKKKARKAALMGFKKKMLKGRSWASLGHSEKEAVEKRLKKKYSPARVAKVAQKLLPGIRQSERERIARVRGGDVNEEFRLLTEPDILDRLVGQLKSKNPSWSDSKAFAVATASLQKRGILKKGSQKLTDKGKKRNSMSAEDRAKDRAAKYSGKSKDDYKYSSKTNRATLKDERNYRDEYDNYQGKPEQIAKRSSRNKARRKLEAEGRVRRGDGKDVDHKDRNPLNNGVKNLRVKSKNSNRSFSRKNEAVALTRNKKYWSNGFYQGKKQALEDGTDRAREEHQAITPGQPVKRFVDVRQIR
tara:strand:+ start:1 stop:1743 length:1743 start_codon:yes stop_codon:yes gene_type:complete